MYRTFCPLRLPTSPVTDMDPSIHLHNSSNISDFILKVTSKFHLHFPEIRFSSSPGSCV
jgi:hypothetical protein